MLVKRTLILTILTVATVSTAFALISPRFTPIHLVRQAETVSILTASPAADGSWTLIPVEALKGNALERGILNITSQKKTESDEIGHALSRNGDAPVMLFAAISNGRKSGFLSVGGNWIEVDSTDGVSWNAAALARRMSGTWAGSTDQLARCARYVIADDEADVPVSVAAQWMDPPCPIAELDKPANALAAVDLPDRKERFLFVASDEGDRLFRSQVNAEAFDDVTAETKLATRSIRFAWCDLTSDGRIDLVSWDGRELRIFEFRKDVTLAPVTTAGPLALEDCLGLLPVRPPKSSRAALLVSTRRRPFFLSIEDGKWKRTDLDAPGAADAIEPAGECLAGDFTGDGLFDLLQPGRKSGLLWKGTPEGFAEPERTSVALDDPDARGATGDFNQDGMLDVCLAGAAVRLFENDGKGAFAEVTASAGSLSYKAGHGVSDCLAVDLNHDGRTDLALLSKEAEFVYHFNRGFRCLGEEGELRLPAVEGADKGSCAQFAAAADFNADGSLDLAVAFTDGRIVCFHNDAFNKPILRVALKPGTPAPTTVSVVQGEKFPLCLGTFAVGPSPARTDFTLHDLNRRECLVKWRDASGAERSITVRIRDPLPQGGIEVIVGE